MDSNISEELQRFIDQYKAIENEIKCLNEDKKNLIEDFKEKQGLDSKVIRKAIQIAKIRTSLGDEITQLDKIVVDKNARGEGAGSKVMQRVCDYADVAGKDIRLTPSKDFGATSVSRLKSFYKRFDFVKNKDNKYKDSMVRYAQ